jgi:MFS family permease
MTGRRFLARLALDTSALRESPAFRRLCIGQLISLVGRQVTVVAVPFQVYSLTRSSLAVGGLGLAQAVPLITGSLVAGPISDRFDRRQILLVTQLSLAACSAMLAVGAVLGHPPLVILYTIVAVAAFVSAVDSPTRQAMVPGLVSAARLPGALSVYIAFFQIASIAGPAVGGLVIAGLGLPEAYGLDLAGFAAAVVVILTLPAQRPEGARREGPFAGFGRGFGFVRRQPVILGGFGMDLAAMVFGLPRAVFPALAVATFHSGALGLGLLYAAPGAGATVAALTTGWLSRSSRLGRVIIVAFATWGIAIILFGFARALWLGLLLLVIAGAADIVSEVCRTTILQTVTPDALRGRVTSVSYMVVVGGPFVGDIEAGAVASAFGAEVSVVSGGVLSLIGLAVSAIAFPAVWAYRRAGSVTGDGG